MLLSSSTPKKKNRAAITLGRKGGRKKVPKGFSTLTPEERSEMAKYAAKKRWEKKTETL